MSARAEQLVLDYLSRVADEAHGILRSDERLRFVTRLRTSIERQRQQEGAFNLAEVRRVLATWGAPKALVEDERRRLDAAALEAQGVTWAAAEGSARAATEGSARAVGGSARVAAEESAAEGSARAAARGSARAAAGRAAPQPDSSPAPGNGGSGKPLLAARGGSLERSSSPQPAQDQQARSGPDVPAAELGIAAAGEPGVGAAGEFYAAAGEPQALAADEPQGLGSAAGEPQAPAAFEPQRPAPAADEQRSTQSPSPALRRVVGPSRSPADGGSVRPAPKSQTVPARASRRGRMWRPADHQTSGFPANGPSVRDDHGSGLGLVSVTRWFGREALAIILLGLGGVVLPFPVWLVGAVIALTSWAWSRPEKFVGVVCPLVVTVAGIGIIGALNRNPSMPIDVQAYIGAAHTDGKLLMRITTAAGALFLGGRLVRRFRAAARRSPNP